MVVFKFCVLLGFFKFYSIEEFLWWLRVVYLVMSFGVEFSFVIFVDKEKKVLREFEIEFFVEFDLLIFLVFSLEFKRKVFERIFFRDFEFVRKRLRLGGKNLV